MPSKTPKGEEVKTISNRILLGELDLPGGKNQVHTEIVDHSRWSVRHSIVFTYNGRHYSTTYSVGATEYQDERPWEHEDEVEVTEVQLVEKLVKVWEPVQSSKDSK
jgi:hypothetical protein